MSQNTWTVADEEKFILEVLTRYDPKVVALVERCHHARLHDAVVKNSSDGAPQRDTLLAQGPLFVVKRHGRSTYSMMLLNRKASTDPSKDTLNVWIGAVPLGATAKLEMDGAQLFINCARTGKDYRLHFTEQDDVARMKQFCEKCKGSSVGTDLRSLLHLSDSSSQLTRSLDDSSNEVKAPLPQMEWTWLYDTPGAPQWRVPNFFDTETSPTIESKAPTHTVLKEERSQSSKISRPQKTQKDHASSASTSTSTTKHHKKDVK